MGSAPAVIIVTHNSQACLEQCLQSLAAQTEWVGPVMVVDSGSDDTTYLHRLQQHHPFELILQENIGFSQANNLGAQHLNGEADHILFLNPDCFLLPDTLATALQISRQTPEAAIVSGKLLGYDLIEKRASGRIDSTGIERKLYGRWVDRGQGEKDRGQYDSPEEMAALCGALLLCKKAALDSLGTEVFDPDFFLYKEDIELSLRLRKKGWKLLYHPDIIAHHCRGWQGEREQMSFELRKTAARSEILLYRKHPSPYMLWALCKYLLVAVFRF